ncbi:MAG: hypothetical protein ACFE8E_03870 [Candidatus Hodarchaeota archaeon]
MDENKKFDQIVERGLTEYFKRNLRIAVKFGKEEYEKVVESGTKEHSFQSRKIIVKLNFHEKN